jgi:hypothetical protein
MMQHVTSPIIYMFSVWWFSATKNIYIYIYSIHEMCLGIYSFRVAVLKGTKSSGLIAEK